MCEDPITVIPSPLSLSARAEREGGCQATSDAVAAAERLGFTWWWGDRFRAQGDVKQCGGEETLTEITYNHDQHTDFTIVDGGWGLFWRLEDS